MWDQGGDDYSGTGGGFMDSTNSQTPGGGGGAGGKKPMRAQNVIPVHINAILEYTGETFRIMDSEVGMVTLVAQVKEVKTEATKNVYTVEDNTGSIDAMLWVDEGQENAASHISENMYVRIVGSVRSKEDKKHVMVYRILHLEDEEEIAAHELEVVYAKLKIKQLQDKETSAIGGDSGLSNSMMTGYGASSNNTSNAGGGNYGNAKQNMVYKMVSACPREEGLSKEELSKELNGKVGKAEIQSALDFLSSEGHIYSSIDEDHYKAMDA